MPFPWGDKIRVEVIFMSVRHLRQEKLRHDLGMIWAVGDSVWEWGGEEAP